MTVEYPDSASTTGDLTAEPNAAVHLPKNSTFFLKLHLTIKNPFLFYINIALITPA